MTDGVRLGFRDDTPFFGDATFGFFRFSSSVSWSRPRPHSRSPDDAQKNGWTRTRRGSDDDDDDDERDG
jgi:hypothetical protein